MQTHEKQLLSVCCEAKTFFAPPSLGESGWYFCDKCSKECETKIVEVELFKQIAKGVYRPVKNN